MGATPYPTDTMAAAESAKTFEAHSRKEGGSAFQRQPTGAYTAPKGRTPNEKPRTDSLLRDYRSLNQTIVEARLPHTGCRTLYPGSVAPHPSH